jgi:hypothetical protein
VLFVTCSLAANWFIKISSTPGIQQGHLHSSYFGNHCSILSYMNQIHTLPHYLRKVHLNIILSSVPGSSKWSPSRGFPTKIFYTFLISPMHATYHPNNIQLKSTSYGTPQYALFTSYLLLHPTSVQIFSSAVCYQTCSVFFP